MIRFVHRYPLFDKQLNALRRSGKKAGIAARETDKILSSLIKGCNPLRSGVLTKYGELRINKCMKYDLGSGYRLITIKQGIHLFMLYVGTHDECNRWLENNKERKPLFTKRRIQSHRVRKNTGLKRESELLTDEDEEFFRPIDDKYLRLVFKGLCRGSKSG